jgi:hypothetical protein
MGAVKKPREPEIEELRELIETYRLLIVHLALIAAQALILAEKRRE